MKTSSAVAVSQFGYRLVESGFALLCIVGDGESFDHDDLIALFKYGCKSLSGSVGSREVVGTYEVDFYSFLFEKGVVKFYVDVDDCQTLPDSVGHRRNKGF